MNESKWDDIAWRWMNGSMWPANGVERWTEDAKLEAAEIAQRLNATAIVGTLVEVGCGVGRLTPHLAAHFPLVLATDTAGWCRHVTRERCKDLANVIVEPGLYPAGDAALVWGNLYDEDWSLPAALEHIAGLLEEYERVLVQTSRDLITNAFAEHWIAQGDDWMLVA